MTRGTGQGATGYDRGRDDPGSPSFRFPIIGYREKGFKIPDEEVGGMKDEYSYSDRRKKPQRKIKRKDGFLEGEDRTT
ncbi:hypothetical protein AVEN_179586-1 [Araneus ventricosus]|uniref:Uncharacterized protein n=1 Tax=Araneus ventricosus TaxID=182803 RepID=A0A4Y2BF98_ARAVE|nr:hypothetical protein AVEN_179586-1 [Araneus ventricosus]